MGTMHLTTLYPKDVRRAQYPYSNDEFVSLHACIISLAWYFWLQNGIFEKYVV